MVVFMVVWVGFFVCFFVMIFWGVRRIMDVMDFFGVVIGWGFNWKIVLFFLVVVLEFGMVYEEVLDDVDIDFMIWMSLFGFVLFFSMSLFKGLGKVYGWVERF